MHEAGIADRILDIAVEQCRAAGARRVTAVHLEAGILAGVSEDALRFHWEQHAVGTPAEGAVLHLALTEEPTDLRFVAIDVEGDDGSDDEDSGTEEAGAGED
jgi:hydrogenase nickel incorporation protein HypA/HybF